VIIVRFLNLGVGGTLLEYGEAMPLGEDIKVSIGPFGELPLFKAEGTVVRVTPDGKTFLHGVDFKELTSTRLRLLGLYMRHLLKMES
jgi:hypothetical protein